MAKKVQDLPEKSTGGPSLYPWDEWLDGDVWELDPGDDFLIPIDNFRTACYQAAKTRHKRVTVRTSKGKLYLQASPAAREAVRV